MNTSNFPGRLERKRAEGAERDAAWAALSFKERLASLDRRLGRGQGAIKQRARLAKQIAGGASKK